MRPGDPARRPARGGMARRRAAVRDKYGCRRAQALAPGMLAAAHAPSAGSLSCLGTTRATPPTARASAEQGDAMTVRGAEIRTSTVLPARRLQQSLRKAANRLPALADLAVLRFNTRGASSEQGASEGTFGDGEAERLDLVAAVAYAVTAGLPSCWLLGWSFGTELALKWGNLPDVKGAILASPPLRRASDADLDAWAASGKPLIALIPELDDYLRPDEARRRLRRVPHAEVVAVPRARHLWVGEPAVRIALNEIVRRVNPAAWPLATEWKDA